MLYAVVAQIWNVDFAGPGAEQHLVSVRRTLARDVCECHRRWYRRIVGKRSRMSKTTVRKKGNDGRCTASVLRKLRRVT